MWSYVCYHRIILPGQWYFDPEACAVGWGLTLRPRWNDGEWFVGMNICIYIYIHIYIYIYINKAFSFGKGLHKSPVLMTHYVPFSIAMLHFQRVIKHRESWKNVSIVSFVPRGHLEVELLHPFFGAAQGFSARLRKSTSRGVFNRWKTQIIYIYI